MREILTTIKVEARLIGVEKRNPILVYQMGKVGSSSVIDTLKGLNLDTPFEHVHTLNSRRLEEAILKHKRLTSAPLPEHLVVSKILVRKLSRGAFPCRIITLTREPIDRAISFLFEDWKKQAPDAMLDGRLDVDLMGSALTRLLLTESGNSDPTIWFEEELQGVFGVNVFDTTYDRAQGFSVIGHPENPVLVVRMEDMDRSLLSALSEFLGVAKEDLTLQRVNVGKHKWYSESFQELKRTYTPPEHLTTALLETRYARHFYLDEVEQIRAKWAK